MQDQKSFCRERVVTWANNMLVRSRSVNMLARSSVCFVYFVVFCISPSFIWSAPLSDSHPAVQPEERLLDPSFNDIASDIAAELHRLREERLKHVAAHHVENPSHVNENEVDQPSSDDIHYNPKNGGDRLSSSLSVKDTKGSQQIIPSEIPVSPSATVVEGKGSTMTTGKAAHRDGSAQKVEGKGEVIHKEGVEMTQSGIDGSRTTQKVSSFEVQTQTGNENPKAAKLTEVSTKETLPNGKSQTLVETEYKVPGAPAETESKLVMSPPNEGSSSFSEQEKKSDGTDSEFMDNPEVSVTAAKNEQSGSGDLNSDFLSPSSLAEYIMATGDEESVAMAVEDLLKDGLLSRDEAIKYLREVKGDLESMRGEAAIQQDMMPEEPQQQQASSGAASINWGPDQVLTDQERQQLEALGNQILRDEQELLQQQQQLRAPAESRSPLLVSSAQQPAAMPFPFPAAALMIPGSSAGASGTMAGPSYSFPSGTGTGMSGSAVGLGPSAHPSSLDNKILAAVFGPSAPPAVPVDTITSVSKYGPSSAMSDNEYGEMVDRLKFVDRIYSEYGLEDVLYKLAKLMFDESLKNSGVSAEKILAKLNAYLKEEERAGRLTPDLQKRIQDVLVASLFDSLQEEVFPGANTKE